MIEESYTREQADSGKAMHPTALRPGYCGPGIKFPNRRAAYDLEARQNKIRRGPLNKNLTLGVLPRFILVQIAKM